MQIELVRDEAVFERLRGEWNHLLERAATHVPFLRAEYQAAWWRERGGGEWPEAALLVAVGREADRSLAGIAPLFHSPNLDGRPALLLVGSVEISDYLDFIALPQAAEAFSAALLERLAAPDVPAWDVLDLYNVPAASPTRLALRRAAPARGLQLSEAELQPTPVIELPADWDTYLATRVAKKERQEIRRKLRRAESNHVTWRMVDGRGPADLPAEIEQFFALMARNPDKARFLTPAMRRQFHLIARTLADCGWLRLAVLEIEGAPAAAYLAFDYRNRLWVYNSAIDPRFNALSPGWVLLGHLVRWAIEQGRTALDFMRGDEDYKFRFGAVPGQIYRLQASRPALDEVGGSPACLMDEFEQDFFPEGQAQPQTPAAGARAA